MRSLRARTGRINCLRTDNQVFALLARFRPEVLFPQRVGSCERTIRCPAVRLRHHSFSCRRARDCSAACHWSSSLHYCNVSALVARLARFYYRVASCNSQHDLWLVGHLYSCPITPHLRAAFLSTLLRLDWLV